VMAPSTLGTSLLLGARPSARQARRSTAHPGVVRRCGTRRRADDHSGSEEARPTPDAAPSGSCASSSEGSVAPAPPYRFTG
jgi:hypothetical protein